MTLGVFLPVQSFEIKTDRYKFFFVYLAEFPSEDFQYWAWICQEFLITDSISFLVINLFKLRFFISILAVCMFLEICPFLLDCSVCWHLSVHKYALQIFCISMASVIISPPSFLILFICVLSFFLVSLARSLLICLSFQKN